MRCSGYRCLVGCGLVALISLMSVSCSQSPALYPVEGKVIFNDQPLAGALVTFHLKGNTDIKAIPSTGMTKEDGTFTLVTGDRNGAPAGDYVVTIICTEQVGVKKGAISTGPPETIDKLKGAYADKANSKIFVSVTSGDNKLQPFVLK